jgi:hypothetical protein
MKPIKPRKTIVYTIKHEILGKCVDIPTDSYWKSVFMDLACDRCTRQVYIRDGIIHITNKKKIEQYNFLEDYKTLKENGNDDHIIYTTIFNNIKQLLITITTLGSEHDSKALIEASKEDILSNHTYKEWKEVRKKSIRDIIMTKFIFKMQSKYALSWENTCGIKKIWHNAFTVLKTHESKDVILVDNEIDHVKDIIYDSNLTMFVNVRIVSNNTSEEKDNDEEVEYEQPIHDNMQFKIFIQWINYAHSFPAYWKNMN